MRKLTLVLLCLLIGIGIVNAQSKASGVVLSAEDGQPIVGAAVVVKGLSQGTVTDADGKFIVNLPTNSKILQVSYMGMKTQDVEAKANMRIVLEPNVQNIDEVVVTALGMKKQEKALGYASSTVRNEELVAGKSGSLMSGLSGKVAGLNITSAGGTGSSQKVIVRGLTSFSANQPLYVIDGIPLMNEFSGSTGTNNTVDFGNGANDINPDDVEAVTVLKGASATALYGSRAANGVIMITTKKANADKMTVTYDGSFMGSNVLRVPQTQNRWGQGWPDWNPMENGSWGPVLDGRDHEWGPFSDGTPGSLTPMVKPFSYIEDNFRNFYKNGFESNNNISIRKGNENLGFVFSYGNVSSNGVLPLDADKFQRNTFSLRGNAKYQKFSIDASLNYVRKDITRPSTGQGGDGATMFQEILQNATDIDISSMSDYTNPYYNTDNYYTAYATNPYFVLANNKNKYQDDRVYGKLELTYDILDGLKAIGRLGGDFMSSRQKRWNEKVEYTPGSWSDVGGKSPEAGTYQELNEHSGQIDGQFLLQGLYKINDDMSVNGMFGWNINQRTYSRLDSYLYGLQQPGWFSLENGADKPLTTSYFQERRLIGAFAQGEFDYRNLWFVNFSFRNDWSSTLPKGKNSFFYGGVNTSILLTDLFEDLKSDALTFLKVRGAWGKTGNDAPVYRTSSYFVPSQIGLGFGNLFLPVDGVMGMTEYNRLPNTDLKPEITTEWEVGLTAHFLQNRLNIDAAYYDKDTKDQIISAALAPETRYTSMTRNVGQINNRGLELTANLVPVRTKDFEWDMGVTFSKNWSKVEKLWGDVQEYVLTGAYSVDFVAKVGEPLGIFKVPKVATTEDGKVIVNSAGRPMIDAASKETIGSSTPDFLMGFNTRFTWKDFSIGAVFDWRKGGYFYSYTSQLLTFTGNSTMTSFNDRQSFVIPNSVKVINGKYVENDIPVTNSGTYNYWNNASNTAMFKEWVLPKDYIKLRELTISYNLPKRVLAKTPLTAVQFSLIGRNLFMWTAKRNNFVDPESTNYGNDITSELGEFATAPTTRTFGGGLKVTF
ncbi:MAG: SusC/RagA family TonB-linked outer membrane protein [Bacteroidales bacterium]